LATLTVASAAWSIATSPKVVPYGAERVASAASAPASIPTSTPEVTRLGRTLAFLAVNSFLAATPEVPTKAFLNVTLDHVIDPATSASDAGSIPGDRWVELEFAVKNRNATPFVDRQPPYYPPLTFVVDNTSYANEPGAQPQPHEGYASVDAFTPRRGRCARDLTIAPGATATACLGFQLPIGVPVVLASVALALGNSGYGTLGEWLVPPARATYTPTPALVSTPSLPVAHLGGTLSLTAPSAQLGAVVERPDIQVTLDGVIDPAPSSLGVPGARDHVVAVRFTLSNVGSATVPCYEDDEYQLSFNWEFDSDSNESSGYTALGLPSGICAHVSDPVANGLAPGATATGDIAVELPIGVKVVNVLVGMGFAGSGDGTTAEWLVP
jgi:hypothetical protein